MNMMQTNVLFSFTQKNTLTALHICFFFNYTFMVLSHPMTHYIILSTMAITAAPSASDLASASSMELPLIP